ncbi:MAG: LptA/OstA family protein [Verrucomicrobiales bacterium]|nr:LptA/OstA family protein [Verrucomicrobiales bacterium]
MKTTYLIATVGSLLLSGIAFTQDEGNSAYRDILENRETQEMLRTLKNDPENVVRAAQENPDDIVRNVTAIFAEQQKKATDGGEAPAVRATRNAKSQTEKAISNLKGMIATPTSDNSQALPVPSGDIMKNFDTSKIDKLKSAAEEVMPSISEMIPDKKAGAPKITGVPSMPEIKATQRPTPKINAAGLRPSSPLNVSSREAPPAPVRSMEPTVPQIPDTPELYASAVPPPQPLARRYPKPEKFQPALAAKKAGNSPKPESDTMVITSSESEMDNKNHLLTFQGDVLVEMDGMEMTCDTLVVHLDEKNEMEKIVATGGTVEIKKIGEGGKLQVAKAKKAEHIAATNTTTLSGGPPYLQNGDQYVNTDSEDSKIVLGGDGKYKVHSPKAIGRTVIVVPIGNSKKFTGDLGIDNKMKGIGQ